MSPESAGWLQHILDGMPKARYQDPTIRQNKNGSYYIRPWVDMLTKSGLVRQKKTIVLGPASMGKRSAVAKKSAVMQAINRADYVIQSQINFCEFLDIYEKQHVNRTEVISSTTRDKYLCHLKNHIRPAFGDLKMCEVTTKAIDQFLEEKTKAGLSWATRMDIRNILSGAFTKARAWGYWKEANPADGCTVGRKRDLREKRKLQPEQTRQLLAALPEDVRLIVETALFCTLRISEVLGLYWKHIDFEVGTIHVRQRFCRGNLDVPKNQRSIRDVPMGYLAERFKLLGVGESDDYVFNVKTSRGICRDDRGINQHFLRKAAKKLGIYYKGFGFHSFRREAVTALSAIAGINQAMRMAGHSSADTSLLYTLQDRIGADNAVRSIQEQLMGKPEKGIQ